MSHARLSPSSAKRWRNCPGSLREIARLPEHEQNRSSRYAEEGSAAHKVAEVCLRNNQDPEEFLGCGVRRPAPEAEFEIVAPRDLRPSDFVVTKDMAGVVRQYVDAVRLDLARLPGSVLLIEQKVKPLAERDDIYGTADAIVWQPYGEVVVHDFKYGAGVVVEHVENDQARTYGLGALRAIGGPEDAESVTMVISQPRARHSDGPVRSEKLDARALWAWGRELLADAERTDAADAPLVPGDWCRDSFCAAAATCSAVRQRALAAAQVDFDDLPAVIGREEEYVQGLLTGIDSDTLGKMLAAVPLFKALVKGVEGLAMRELQRGAEVPGFKLVRKRAIRRWRDEGKLSQEIEDAIVLGSLTREEAFKTELRSPAQIEKLMPKNWVAERCFKPEGDVTIAPILDPRPAVTSIPAEFTVIEEENT